MPLLSTNRVHFYTSLAFGVLVLAAFAQLTFADTVRGQPWQVPVTFTLGAAYYLVANFCHSLVHGKNRWTLPAYYVIQCLLVATMIMVSPSRGLFSILALPIASQALFDFQWRGASLVVLWAFVASIAPYGSRGAMSAAISYAPLYVFVLVFSWLSRASLAAKQQAERLSRELTEANEKLRAHAAQTEEFATTRERNRLAREIHDGVGHYLTVIKVQLDAASATLVTQPDTARRSVATAARPAAEALDDVRRSVGALRTDTPRPPLPEALRTLVAQAAPVPTVQIDGPLRALPPTVEHALFRTAQEGLTNIRKHARATAASVHLDYRDAARVRLAVIDNGPGPESAAPAGGFGLTGLRERVELLGGRLDAGPRSEGGFALVVEVPA